MKVIYEDNHLIIVSKTSGEIVQGDKTGDVPLSETVKAYIKEVHQKPGNVFLGVVHRLDRPVSGVVVFAKTSKCLSRLNDMFRRGEVHKTYWAVVEKGGECKSSENVPGAWVRLHHWLLRNERQNKSYAYDHEVPHSKEAMLEYKILAQGERYNLLEVKLLTGRHHQIRCQLAATGQIIKGDLKYGARRSNPDGSISLLARQIEFLHPVSKITVTAQAPLPDDRLWQALGAQL